MRNIFSRRNNAEVFKYLKQTSWNCHLFEPFVRKLKFTQRMTICFKSVSFTKDFLLHMIHFAHFPTGKIAFQNSSNLKS